MTNFQKLFLIILSIFILSSLFLFNQFLNNQKQVKKDELSFKEKQQKISDCKYLLSQGEDILHKQQKISSEADALYKVDQSESTRQYSDEQGERVLRFLSNYVKQSTKCREFLLRTGY